MNALYYGIVLGALFVFSATTAMAQEIVFPDESWEVVEPEAMYIDSEKLEEAIASLPDSSRTMVIRNGRVIWQGEDADDAHSIWSITKAFASTALGMLIDDEIITLDTTVASYNPALDEDYSDATFGHLTKQTSNITGDIFRPGTPSFENSGSHFHYNTQPGNNALSHGLQVAAEGQTVEEFLTDRLANPLGMDTTKFDFGDIQLQNGEEKVTINEVRTGMEISASNLARFGLLYMSDGNWNGDQVLSAEWVQTATDYHLKGVPVHEGSDFTANYGMGGWFRFTPHSFDSFGGNNSRLWVNQGAGLIVASIANKTGDTDHNPSTKLISELQNAAIPLVWDGNGNGAWHDSSPSGTRWLFDEKPNDFPPDFYSVIREDTVAVTKDLRVYDLMIENGGSIDLMPDVEASIARLNTHDSTVSIQGNFEFVEAELTAGHLDVSPRGAILGDSLRLNSVDAVVRGAADVETLTVTGGSEVTLGDNEHRFGGLSIVESHLHVANGEHPIHVGSGRIRDASFIFNIDEEPWERSLALDPSLRRWGDSRSEVVLELSPHVNPANLVGKSLRLFDWGTASIREFGRIEIPSQLVADISSFYSDGMITIDSVRLSPLTQGDFNGDGILDGDDLNLLSLRIQVASRDLFFDFDSDDQVSITDADSWLADLRGTLPGDANLDGEVALNDFLILRNNFGIDGTYTDGDFNFDGSVDFLDFLVLAENFSSNGVVAAVPESSGVEYFLFGLAYSFSAWRVFGHRTQPKR